MTAYNSPCKPICAGKEYCSHSVAYFGKKKRQRVRCLYSFYSLTVHILGGASANATLSLVYQKICATLLSHTSLPWKESSPVSYR